MGLHDGHRRRKKEQFLQNGLDSFADHEVLELLLFYAIPRRDTNETAHRLLKTFGSLRDVLSADPAALEKVEGVGENAAALLCLSGALGERLCRSDLPQILNSVESAGAYFCRLLRTERREVLYQACIDGKGKLLSCCRLSAGTTALTAVSVREVVENALRADATTVVLAHNHPSGVALPSQEDRQVTLQIQRALDAMNIALADHIVVADGDFVSMAASGMLA